jgi:hypothetical protein
MVPLTVLVLALDEALLVEEVPLDAEDELDEEHAARPRAVATTATPTVVTCCLRPSGISGTPFRFNFFPSAASAAPTAGQYANRGVRVQFAGVSSTGGQMHSG